MAGMGRRLSRQLWVESCHWSSPALPSVRPPSRVKIGTDDNDISTYVDKDSIQRGGDGLVYFTDFDDSGDDHDAAVAANCQTRVLYLLKYAGKDYPDWRSHGEAVTAGSVEESELKYVCANAG
jgi:hypothetical protein